MDRVFVRHDNLALYWLATGWRILISNFRSIFPLVLALYCYHWIINGIGYLYAEIPVEGLENLALGPSISAGYIYFYLKFVRGERGKINDVFQGFVFFLKVWVTTFLLLLIIIAGLLLLVIPGIIWNFRYIMAPIIVIDYRVSPLRALRISRVITKGYILPLILTSLPSVPFAVADILLYAYVRDAASNLMSPITIIWLLLHTINIVLIGAWMCLVMATAYDYLTSNPGYHELAEVNKA
jgi:hypothetical protein